jgi:hypothetical protein
MLSLGKQRQGTTVNRGILRLIRMLVLFPAFRAMKQALIAPDFIGSKSIKAH